MRSTDDKAKQYALKILRYRGRSLKELKEKLIRKGFSETSIASTINYLQYVGLIDDHALAEALKREAMNTKFLSQYATRRFMIHRGIPKEIVDSLFIPDEKKDVENAKRILEKKLKVIHKYPDKKIKKRLHDLLLRRGYSFETIKTIMMDTHIQGRFKK